MQFIQRYAHAPHAHAVVVRCHVGVRLHANVLDCGKTLDLAELKPLKQSTSKHLLSCATLNVVKVAAC